MRMDVQVWLEQIAKLDELINAKLAEREQVWAMATRMVSQEADGLPHAKGNISDPVGTGVVRLQMLEQEIDRLIDKYVDCKQQILKVLEKLSAKDYGVLHRYYIRHMTLEQIAEDMGYSRQQISKIKKKALENLEMRLNAVECYIEM
jgi:DNA-directed RNA polymerase specialized sigma subunit